MIEPLLQTHAENLKRELPRLPLADVNLRFGNWDKLVEIGRKLGDLHVGYERATPFDFPLRDTTPNGLHFSFRVEKCAGWKIKPNCGSMSPSN